ncbi:CARDB domain-containing protein [Halobellus sp. GM3]|uniref:CARDB domain-containing protein n=1 Tax=Halobellus sp. GM3 TaxID=3458410 RepID=UPI00403DE9C3
MAPVQRGDPASVSQDPTTPEPGDNITFDVDASNQLGDSGVTHVVAVYNKEQFTSSSHNIKVDPNELDSNFDIQNDSTFEHSIADVDGVADIEKGAGVNGIDLSDGRVSRAVGFGATIDFIAEDLNGTAPKTNRTGNEILNASIDADVGTNGSHQLVVETKNSWEDGTYQYVYLGTLENNKSAITTDVGTFDVSSTTPYFDVEIASIDDPVTAGDDIGVTLNITNTGPNGTDTVSVSVNDGARANVTETLDTGESTQTLVSVPTTQDDVGEATVRAESPDDSASTTITINERADFTVDLTLDNETVDPGDTITGTANVTNEGGTVGDTQNLTVTIDDTEIKKTSINNLSSGASQEVDFSYQTTGSDAGTRTVTASTEDNSDSALVTVREPANFEVDVIEGESDLDVIAGQNATIVAEVENTGGVTDTQTVTVSRNGNTLASEQFTLEAGEITDIEAENETLDADAPDGFDVTVESDDDSETVSVTVEEATTYFDVTVDDINGSVDEPLPGNETNITVDATIKNLGNSNEYTEQTIQFGVDGTQKTSREVNLTGGGSTTLNDVKVPINPGQTPSVEVTVASDDETETRTVEVNSTAEFDVTIVEASNESQLDTQTPFSPTINVTNVGEQPGDGLVQVRFNGSIEENFSINALTGGTTDETVKPNSGFSLNASTSGTKIVEAEVINNGTDASDDTSTRRVNIGDAPNFTIESFTLNPSGTIEEGNTLTIDATVNNTGDVTGNQTVVFEFDDTEINATVTNLASATQKTISVGYQTRRADIGSQTVSVSTDDDVVEDTVTVEENAEFEVTNVDADDTAIAGDSADVAVTVENVGGVARNTSKVRLFAAGEEVANQSVTLGSDEARIVQFDGDVTPSAAGELTVTAVTDDDTGTDTIDVGEPGELEYELVSITDPVTTNSQLQATVRATNVGDGDAQETVSLRVDGQVVDSTTATAAGGETTQVTLSHTVGSTTGNVAVDILGPDGQSQADDTVTIENQPEPYFRVSNLDAPASVLNTSQTVNITANVTNIGDLAGTQNVTLSVDGETRDTNESLTLDSDNTTTVDLAFNTDDVDTGDVTYSVTSENQSRSGTITINEPTPGTAAIVSTDVLTDEAQQGESFDVNATIENTGDLDLTETVELDYRANGTIDDDVQVSSLGAGNTTTVTLTATPSAEPRAGTFDRELEVSAGDDSATTTVPVDFNSIQSGINAVSGDDDTVLVASETFTERNAITIQTDGVTLKAANPNARPTIQSPRNADTGLIVTADDITISSLRFSGDGSGTGIALDGDSADVTSVRVENWTRGITDTGGNQIRGSAVVDSGTGIILDGTGGSTVEYTRIARSDTRGMFIRSPDNTIRGMSVFTSTIGIDVSTAPDNEIRESIIRGNDDIGIRVRNVPGSLTNPVDPSAIVQNNALESNGVNAFIDNSSVNATSNWWGSPGVAEENVDYIVRSSIAADDPLQTRPDSQFDVSATLPSDVTRDEQFTITTTVENTGTKTDLQTVGLVVDTTVVDSTDVELDAGESKNVDLSYTPDITDGDSIDLTVRSLDDSASQSNVQVLDPAVFSITSYSPTTSVTEGDTISVSPEITNTGEASAEDTVRLLVNGSQVDTASTGSISGSGTATPTLSYTTGSSDVGTINLTVATTDDSQSASVTVDEASDTDDGDDTGGSGSSRRSEVANRVTTQIGADGTATADLTDGVSVSQVQISNPGASGEVTVEELTDLPEGTPEPTRSRIATVDISAPDPAEGSTATVRVSVRESALPDDVTPNELVVEHYINGQWRDLETTVVSSNGDVVVEAETDGFSPFAVTYQQQTPTPEPVTDTPEPDTDTPEPTSETDTPEPDTDTPTPGDDGGSGGIGSLAGILIALIVLAGGAYWYFQQNN